MATLFLRIALDTPLDTLFDYRWIAPLEVDSEQESPLPQVGQLALVPFGSQKMVGLIVALATSTAVPEDKLRDVLAVRSSLAALDANWMALVQFAAEYYQRPLGEVALPALPKNIKAATTLALDKGLKRLAKRPLQSDAAAHGAASLNDEQRAAVSAITGTPGFSTHLLFGVTGSGKTEVYLHAAAAILAASERAQVLILVPEINLTPQFEAHIRARFPGLHLATLHSGMAEGARSDNWLAAHLGRARIVLGTRLAMLASLPDLKLIIVDEEHDPSYKQQEGLRYSARDLAIWRGHRAGIAVVLGSATPSLESWQAVQSGRYRLSELSQRAVAAAVLPIIRMVNLEREKPVQGLTPRVTASIRLRLDKGEQSLLFLNRRGYAPVLACDACGWLSNCTRCTANLVLHKGEHRLRCHHCGLEQRIPRACPTCGNVDLQPLGRGTQRLEESLAEIFPEARVLRIDADSTRLKGSAAAAFNLVHDGSIDILIGTQMVAKGHDFKRLTLVAALNPDAALFSQDYRAAERLFAQLMQVSGRAGRTAQNTDGNAAEVLVQTRYPDHPLYHALIGHNYRSFAADMLQERRQAELPPFMYQALLRAEARELALALEFLQQAAVCLEHPGISIHDPIPMTMMRVANVERAQLLIESVSRPALQAFAKAWIIAMRALKSRVKWSLEIDPVDI
ncbi:MULTISPECIES: primosomal protein N' [unclassified Undibacterium]|uniref:primosomal protein N' n=1 Tax=unclassified Undibacterium TaxID=2630295 RepID=UPI002AC9B3B2|nr:MULTISPECIES: primosomal protein N' [unclassified Undibacterium]MEB0137862.1 primosomal protein N' [Undibacterium sp. CCC2.1]MEB0170947.1 primosomal protein N' [Undibacterium sp. CCC1.1]MEB0174992.1 primosomal protein N' [Undibacterium sp. CCC3.4]MEB0215802.1 primosomal protein N' [Undibacterium sp. 5I2]WPX44798.1 primosomal protein N' [Undibacterium sp. CCC3.4]